MAWIKAYQSLPTHKKLKKLKRLLKVKTPAAVGHVVMLWLWAIDNAPDGYLADLDSEDIAEAAEWQGDPEKFVDALVGAGFVDWDVNGDVSVLHGWDEYTGGLMDARSEAKKKHQERQKRYRERQKSRHGDVTGDADGDVTQTSHSESVTRHCDVTETVRDAPRIDKNRIDKNRITSTPDGVEEKSVTRDVTHPPLPREKSGAVDAYMARINPTPSSASMYELLHFEGELGTDVCLRAIDEALDANARSWQYVKAILRAKQEQGVRSLADWDRLEAQRMDAKARRTAQQQQAEEAPPVDVGDIDLVLREI